MGGDHGPHVTVPAALAFQARSRDVELVLVGLPEVIRKELKGPGARVHPASEVVAMDESPAQALRYKKDSSMRVAIDLVKTGEAHACVSAGNTGALMAISRFVLKTLPGIDRPAIATVLPKRSSVAIKTAPIPPCPICRSTRYRPCKTVPASIICFAGPFR